MNLATRYGGDEFLCILSDTDAEGGATQASRVISAVKRDPRMGGVGVSAGVATYQAGMRTPEELIRRADEELYGAKSKGAARGS
jgi:two-component system cell cycle response regulator